MRTVLVLVLVSQPSSVCECERASKHLVERLGGAEQVEGSSKQARASEFFVRLLPAV